MCQQVVQFCSNSARPLLLVGGALTLLVAGAIGYTAHANQTLYQDIDSSVAASHSLAYYLQLAAAGYLLLLTIFTCLTVHYEHKQSIRALAVVTTVNIVLAGAAILMMPSGAELTKSLEPRLLEAQKLYDLSEKLPVAPAPAPLNRSSPAEPQLAEPRPKRWADGEPLNATLATRIWDRLQARGCCGLKNYTDWAEALPKSCCSSPAEDRGRTICREPDAGHQCACLEVIEAASSQSLLALALLALASLYLSLVSGVNAYRTFHYDEASQNAYT